MVLDCDITMSLSRTGDASPANQSGVLPPQSKYVAAFIKFHPSSETTIFKIQNQGYTMKNRKNAANFSPH
jgi:hypothetical protein